MNQIKSSTNEMSQKDVQIVQLEKQLSKYTFDNNKLLKETIIIFPEITSLSVSYSEMRTAKDSTIIITAVIYDSKTVLSTKDKDKFRDWLNQRLSVKNVEIYKKQ